VIGRKGGACSRRRPMPMSTGRLAPRRLSEAASVAATSGALIDGEDRAGALRADAARDRPAARALAGPASQLPGAEEISGPDVVAQIKRQAKAGSEDRQPVRALRRPRCTHMISLRRMMSPCPNRQIVAARRRARTSRLGGRAGFTSESLEARAMIASSTTWISLRNDLVYAKAGPAERPRRAGSFSTKCLSTR